MIKTFSMSRLLHPEYLDFMGHVESIVQSKNPTALSVKPQYDFFVLKLNEFKDIYKTAQASPISVQIKQADAVRDQDLIGIIRVVDGYTYYRDEEMRNAAVLLDNNIKLYGRNMMRDNLARETANIDNLVNDWRTKPELQNAVDMLGILDWVLLLEAANNEFKRLHELRNTEYAQRPDENLDDKRVEVTEAYSELCKFLNSYSVINTTNPDYGVVIAELNSYVDQYSTLIKQTGTRKPVVDSSQN